MDDMESSDTEFAMNPLKVARLPSGITLAWAAPDWAQLIIPPDSAKKRLLRRLSASSLIQPLLRNFDGTVRFSGRNLDLNSTLEAMGYALPRCSPAAVFVNGRRQPPRLYLWLQIDGKWAFLKIGELSTSTSFKNEAKICSELCLDQRYRIALPMKFGETKCVSYILAQGLSPIELAARQPLMPREFLNILLNTNSARRGPFGGAVHGDLGSNNAFRMWDKILIMDWEFASKAGPDFCDAVALAAATEKIPKITIDTIDQTLNGEFSFGATKQEIVESLKFLAKLGNPHALRIIANNN